LLQDVPDVLIPAFWFEQSAMVDDTTAGQIKLILHSVPLLFGLVFPLLLLLLCVILVGTAVLIYRRSHSNKKVNGKAGDSNYVPIKMATLGKAAVQT